MSLTIYVEGGGNGVATRARCRRGFSEFFSSAGLAGRMPKVVPCGPRKEAYEAFCRALASGQGGSSLLLVDSEGRVSEEDPWVYLKKRQQDQWTRPEGSTSENCHLMVQCMESWLVADPEALARLFGRGFEPRRLPQHADLEAVTVSRVLDGLEKATGTSSRGKFRKGKDAFDALAETDPSKVEEASPWARRFLDHLKAMA